jgi:hypothetical protein
MNGCSGFLRAVFNSILDFAGTVKARDYDTRKTIIICASPRGGSTWLAEILNTLPGYSLLWEPLSLNEVPQAREIGFTWRTYIAPKTEWPEAEEFLRRILTGQFLNRHTLQASGFRSIFGTRGWIVKFCRGNMLLRWLTERFSTNVPILLIRHPCAVVASQMRHGRWKAVTSPRVDATFIQDYPQFEILLSRINTWEEALACTWCLEYFAPLVTQKPHPWLLVTYEKLVRDGEAELERIFSALGFEVPADARRHLRIPSFTTKPGSHVEGEEDQLALWKRRLSHEQIERILRIVRSFGLDFYTDELEPDYDRIYSDNPVRL